jgi:hypothetical protein
MNCKHIQDILQEQFLATGMELPSEMQAHLKGCAECRSFHEELVALSSRLAPMADITLTEEETARLESSLQKAMASTTHDTAVFHPKRKRARIIRLATSIAAAVLLVAASVTIDWSPDQALQHPLDALDFSGATIEDIAPLFINGESDLVPTVIDGESAFYLTQQVGPGQVDDIFENVTSEEIDWLMKNLSVEI